MKRWVLWTLSITAAIVIGLGGYGVYLYSKVKDTADKIYEPLDVERSQSITGGGEGQPDGHKISKDARPVTILVMGVDQRKHDVGRTDSLVLLSLNPAKKTMLMFNIPRDTRTEIVGHGTVDKINHAYAFGGVKMSVQTVEKFLGVQVDYYVKVNMEGFSQMIDILGGIQVNNELAFKYEGTDFPKGEMKLDGKTALKYSRMRYDDPRGDLGRNDRQRKVLRAMLDKVSPVEVLTDFTKIMNRIGSSVKTNITFKEMKDLNSKYRVATEHIESVEVKGSGERINHIYYYIVSETERDRISQLVRNELQQS